MGSDEAAVCEVYWDVDLSAVVGAWQEPASGAVYRKHMDEMVALLAEREGHRLLGDCRELGSLPQADREWTREDWLPRAVAAGLDYSVVVYPEDTVGRTQVDSMVRADADPDAERVFVDDIQTARDWLRTR